MESFKEYISHQGALHTTVSGEELERIVEIYPWFTTARMMLAHMRAKKDERLALSFFMHPTAKPFLERISPADFLRQSTDEIIDRFLSSGEHRIVPKEDIPDFEVDQQADFDADDQEFVSEELAEIYLKQGHTKQAKEIYEKLSLLYPKKSVYFAEIISTIDSRQ